MGPMCTTVDMNVNCGSLTVIFYNIQMSTCTVAMLWDWHDKLGLKWPYSNLSKPQGVKKIVGYILKVQNVFVF